MRHERLDSQSIFAQFPEIPTIARPNAGRLCAPDSAEKPLREFAGDSLSASVLIFTSGR